MIVFFRYLACCEKIHHGCVSCPVRKQVLEWEPLKLNQAECWKFAVYRVAFTCHFLHRIIQGFSASVSFPTIDTSASHTPCIWIGQMTLYHLQYCANVMQTNFTKLHPFFFKQKSGKINDFEYKRAVFAETSHFVSTSPFISKGNYFMYHKWKIPPPRKTAVIHLQGF